MRYGYYPGCSLEGISLEYDHSMRSLFRELEVEVQDLAEWICCGTVAAPSTSRLLGLATPLWNLAQAKEEGFDQIIAPCSACVYHFKNAALQVDEEATLQDEVEDVLGRSLDHAPPAIHPLELLSTEPFEAKLKGRIKRDLSELKVVCYYGCHISRPSEVMKFDDPENPQSMDRVVSWVGVEVRDWPRKVDCCGAHFSLIKPEIVIDLCEGLVESALEVGAEAIVVACPMCHANLDTRQSVIMDRLGREESIPVLYFSQVLGYALGLSEKAVGFKRHIINPIPMLQSLCQARSYQEVEV
jgi:heterodisulfide reductase subunit B